MGMGGISAIFLMAAGGFALTAGHLQKRQVTKRSCPCRSVPRPGSAFPRSGPAPWASRGGDHRHSRRGGLIADLALGSTAFPCGSETGLPAMGVNDDPGCLDERGVLAFFASRARSYKGSGSHGQNCRSQLAGDGRQR